MIPAPCICGGIPKCLCGEMLQNPELRCPMHPDVVVKTQEEKIQFRLRWDERVGA